MTSTPIPQYSPLQPERIIGYRYRGIYIYGSSQGTHFRTSTPRGRGRTDKLTLTKTIRIIDKYMDRGATADEHGAMGNIDFIDYRKENK